MSDRSQVRLRDLTSKIGSGATPRGGKESYKESGIPLIRSLNVFDLEFDDDGLAFIDDAQARDLDNVTVLPGDVLVNITGASVARCCLAPTRLLPARVNQHVAIVRPNPDVAVSAFVAYLLASPYYKSRLLSIAAGGATREALTKRTLEEFDIELPPLEDQRKIAAVLAAYDELIENNLRRIKILEEMAQTVYREWFVNFRFPGHENIDLVDSPLGPIPDGWAVSTVSDAISLNPRVRLERDVEYRFVPMGSLAEGSMVITGLDSRTGPSGAQFRNDDTLFARITPSLENGKTAYVQCLDLGEIACGSTEFIVMRARTLTPEFVYCLARTEEFRGEAIKSMVGASGRQRVQEVAVAGYLFVHPTVDLLDRFSDVVKPMFTLVQLLVDQNENLRTTRDLLLPKLVSGEIDVSDLDIDTEWLVA